MKADVKRLMYAEIVAVMAKYGVPDRTIVVRASVSENVVGGEPGDFIPASVIPADLRLGERHEMAEEIKSGASDGAYDLMDCNRLSDLVTELLSKYHPTESHCWLSGEDDLPAERCCIDLELYTCGTIEDVPATEAG